MTVQSDIVSALSSYDVQRVVYAGYGKPTTNSVAEHKVEVHVLHASLDTSETICAALQALSGYKSIRARVISSWPFGDLYYSRFEVDIRT